MKSSAACLILITSLLASQASGQERQVWNNRERGVDFKIDTAHIRQLIRDGSKMKTSNPDSSFTLLETAYYQSKQIGYPDGIAASLLGTADLYMDKGNFTKVKSILDAARPYCEISTYQKGKFAVNMDNSYAVMFTHTGDLDSAAYYYFEALRQFEKKGMTDTSQLLNIYCNLGGTWLNDGQQDKALYYLHKGEDIAVKAKNDFQLGRIYNNIAGCYGAQKSYDTAIAYGKQAIALGKKNKDIPIESFANYAVGSFYYYKKDYAQSLTFYQNALKVSPHNSMQLLVKTARGIGLAYVGLKEYSKAKQYLTQSLELSTQSNMTKDKAQAYNDLAAYYDDIKNYKEALKYKEAYSELVDSTLNAEKVATTNTMEVKFRTSEKDKELALRQLQLNKQQASIRQKNILFGSALGGIALLGALTVSIYKGQKRKRKLQHIQITVLHKEKEMVQLKARMKGEEDERVRIARELHDGIMVQFSSVKMNLSAMLNRSPDPVQKKDIDKIVQQLDSATKELRKSAHNLMPDMLLEEGLSEAVHYFLSNLEQSAGMQIEFQQYGTLHSIATEYQLMLYRMIQELAQNAIKHAKASHILVQLSCQDNSLSLTVEDNGVGFKEQALQHNRGMGIKGIQGRVHSLGGHMDIRKRGSAGTTIYIEFDINNLQQTPLETNAYTNSNNR